MQQSGIHGPRAISLALRRFIARIFQGYHILHTSLVSLAKQETDKCTRALENNFALSLEATQFLA